MTSLAPGLAKDTEELQTWEAGVATKKKVWPKSKPLWPGAARKNEKGYRIFIAPSIMKTSLLRQFNG